MIEACRFANYFNAKLYVVHIGEDESSKRDFFNQVIEEFGFDGDVEFVFKQGNPVKTLSRFCDENKIDLLILGAVKREKLLKHYLGSVARKLTQQVKCSVFLVIRHSEEEISKKHIVVNGFETEQSQSTISTAFYVAKTLSSKKITIVEEIKNNKVKVDDDRSLRRATITHERKVHQENLRIKKIIDTVEHDYKNNIEVKLQGIFGKSGYSIGHYARVVRADLLIMDTARKQNVLKKMVANDLRFLLSELPTDVLILK
ncbi:universal stress protein [Wenyingzhuangia sp. 2_MG-2023]|uniref:universal stress protein n=1 Tax=Wenyingzhuangia sp. 2_MG-2023 TaxID=3062639 RepID=UPI0026E2CD59|nr:universal stress protein [Wenyingzhuangia sp. 2_MG-2023]MDO6739055.1 universal stress protein [Wenyingzhuangia sp. 2_MG-2023]